MATTKKPIRKTKAQKIGDRGEIRIVDCLKLFIPEKKIIHDIIFSNGDSTSQVDAIAVTNAGIFVIEVKNFCADKIYCNPDWKYWYYILPDKHHTNQKCTFYNPLWQNATHVSIIDNMFHGTLPVYSIVTFAKGNPLCFENCTRPKNVVNIFDLKKYITNYTGNISEETQLNIINTLLANRRTDVTLAEHIDNISKYK